jgi:hypothetical protein
MTALAKTNSNCKRQTRPLVIESTPHQQTRNLSHSNKNLVLGPKWSLTPRQTALLDIGRNIILTLSLEKLVLESRVGG